MPTFANPFRSDGVWLRCALHAHTTNSDGEFEPQALVEHYRAAGFDVLATTDHWYVTEVDGADLLVIPSAELNAWLPHGRDGHVLAFGIDGLPQHAEPFASLRDAAGWITAHGGVAYLAHPYWSGADVSAVLEAPDVSGIEIFNAACELENGRGLASVHWDELLEAGARLPAIATDDAHRPPFEGGRAWTVVRAAERSAAAVLDALRAGCFYTTTGPKIRDVLVDDEGVEVHCDPCSALYLHAGPEQGASIHAGQLRYANRSNALETAADGSITVARFQRPPTSSWGRVEVRDAARRACWTNAVSW